MEWIYGFAGSLLIAGTAYRVRSLSASGLAAAIILGTTMYALGSPVWFGTLIAFFISSSLLSKYKRKRKESTDSLYEKSGRRDAAQVLANGGLAGALCLLGAAYPSPLLLALFVGVMAAVNADTWATELGGLSLRPPRSILTGKVVLAGTSGGVTPLGLAASAAGGLFIGGIAAVLLAAAPDAAAASMGGGARRAALLLAAGFAGGAAGSLADSALGAAWQGMYRCAVCGRELERPEHCGAAAVRSRGWRWLGNDAVNLISSLIGGAAAAAVLAPAWL